jgi:hypothetical protein
MGISRCDFLINDKGLNIVTIRSNITQGKRFTKKKSLLWVLFSGLSNGRKDSAQAFQMLGLHVLDHPTFGPLP